MDENTEDREIPIIPSKEIQTVLDSIYSALDRFTDGKTAVSEVSRHELFLKTGMLGVITIAFEENFFKSKIVPILNKELKREPGEIRE